MHNERHAVEPLFGINGLMFWSEREIRLRQMFTAHFYHSLRTSLMHENAAWQFVQVEAPLLTPQRLLNPNYLPEDIWRQEMYAWSDELQKDMHVSASADHPNWLALRPETTPGSYVYAQHLFSIHSGYRPPLCVWQIGKSFRREQDQVSKNMRLKEFYQQEFQCIYTDDTMNDYHSAMLEPVRKMLAEMIGLPTRIVASDRLPSYSQITMDVEVDNGDKWMEVCSISRRTDFPAKVVIQGRKGAVEKTVLVLEIAIGLDRAMYNFERAAETR